jgi:hypothetical protein
MKLLILLQFSVNFLCYVGKLVTIAFWTKYEKYSVCENLYSN